MGEALKKVAGKSWKTSAAGWLLVVGVVAHALHALLDGNPATVPSFEAVLGALAGAGLIAARDNGVTSEAAGAK